MAGCDLSDVSLLLDLLLSFLIAEPLPLAIHRSTSHLPVSAD